MAKRKTKKRTGNIFARVQRTPKVRSVKSKIRKKKSELKALSRKYKSAVKTESKRLAKKRK